LVQSPSTTIPDISRLFSPPDRYLGDQRASYNQELRFSLRVLDPGARPSVEDVVIEGGGARTTRIATSITEQGNPTPSMEVRYQTLTHQFSPRVSRSKSGKTVLLDLLL
jgi:hypothetical protein